MRPEQHLSNNLVLGAPTGWSQDTLKCDPLAVTTTSTPQGNAFVSYWRPSKHELEQLIAGQRVQLWIFGDAHPPVAVQVETKGS